MSADVDWREEALVARAALYLLKVATARPDLPRVSAWERARAMVIATMDHACSGPRRACDEQWADLDWRRDTLTIMTRDHDVTLDGLDASAWRTFRPRVLALLDGP